jgi:nucleotidyltransferase substrate binding protein (TIGR01987 family)
MERLRLKHKDAMRALNTLEEISKEPFSIIVRDATIQRFEYTFEALWKFVKEYLKEHEGIHVNSPKACFRSLLSTGLLTEEETNKCLEMTDRRNDTSHTYKEAVAEIIFGRINDDYVMLIKEVLRKLSRHLHIMEK